MIKMRECEYRIVDGVTKLVELTEEEISERDDKIRYGPISPKLSNDKFSLSHNCPKCGEVCQSLDYRQTLVGYYSPPGHNHDDNCRKFSFTCEACKYKFLVRVQNFCPNTNCDWEGKKYCLTCGENVRDEYV